jgi:C-terminal processing protease CtpA/Prc
MRLLFFTATLLFFGWYSTAFAQSAQVTKYITEITGIVKNNSIVTSQIDWPKYQKDVDSLSGNINSIDSCRPVLDYVIQTLRTNGDKHSFFIYKSLVKKLNTGSVQPKPAEARLLDAHTAYIKVPGIMSLNTAANNAFRDTIQQLIRKLDTENDITAWVVDLRHNTGGNMWPMIAGLNALIQDGIAGYWVSSKNKRSRWYSYGRSMMGAGKFYKIKRRSSPIAVLIDGHTASSGEMTAISFLGLPYVKTFGQPSAGYTTANYTFVLSSGVILQLATSYAADRKKHVYKDRIVPDVLVKENAAGADDTLEAAMKWIMHNAVAEAAQKG